jgi:hypothetical protein
MTAITFPPWALKASFICIRLICAHYHVFMLSDDAFTSALKMKTASSSETLVTTYQATRYHDPEPQNEWVSIAVTLLRHIRELLCSNLGQDTDYPDGRFFFAVFLSSSWQMPRWNPNWPQPLPFMPFRFVIHPSLS